jgi:hypothetical protein
MTKPAATHLFRLAPLLALCACAPKAVVVEEPAAPKQETAAEPEASEPMVPAPPDDKLRLGNMETLPGDDEFRATNPNLPTQSGDSGTVIARPPTDPPPRPKAKDGE